MAWKRQRGGVSVLAEGLALSCALIWGVRNVIITPVAKDGRATRLLGLRCAFAILFILPLSPFFVSSQDLEYITLRNASVIVFVSAPAFAAGVVIYYRNIQTLGISRSFPIANIFPVFSILPAILVLGERLHLRILTGTAMIIVGVRLIAVPRHG